MFIIITVTQALLYICYSIIMGSFLLNLVPNNYKPLIYLPRKILLISLGGIVIFSFIPVLPLILHLNSLLGFTDAVNSVLLTFQIGKSWLFTFVVSLTFVPFLVFFNNRKTIQNIVGILFTLILISAVGWSSHASSLNPVKGFLSDSTHLTAVSVWVGILFIISWFSKDESNWLPFLKWFTPVAISCLVITAISGIVLMTFVIDFNNYYNSWMIPYGQSLLIKHILIIPLLVYAFINGFFIKRRLNKEENFNPKPWARIESIIILFVFTATSALSQQSPPKETAITEESVSPIFKVFHQGEVELGVNLQVGISLISILFLLLTLVFLILTVVFYFNKKSSYLSLVLGILSLVSIYLSLMYIVS